MKPDTKEVVGGGGGRGREGVHGVLVGDGGCLREKLGKGGGDEERRGLFSGPCADCKGILSRVCQDVMGRINAKFEQFL